MRNKIDVFGNNKTAQIMPRFISPVLIYAIVGEELRLLCTGTHADLFKKIIAQVPDTFQVAGTFYTS